MKTKDVILPPVTREAHERSVADAIRQERRRIVKLIREMEPVTDCVEFGEEVYAADDWEATRDELIRMIEDGS